MPKEQHVHKWKKLRYKSGNEIFFCTLPDCNKKINPALALGKRCICWRCGNQFILNDYAIRLVKPHCEDCHNAKKETFIGTDTETVVFDEMKPSKELSLSERLQEIVRKAQKDAEGDI